MKRAALFAWLISHDWKYCWLICLWEENTAAWQVDKLHGTWYLLLDSEWALRMVVQMRVSPCPNKFVCHNRAWNRRRKGRISGGPDEAASASWNRGRTERWRSRCVPRFAGFWKVVGGSDGHIHHCRADDGNRGARPSLCSFELFSEINSHPVKFFSHNKWMNSTSSHSDRRPMDRMPRLLTLVRASAWRVLLSPTCLDKQV
jgi:hypothetical protein